MIPMLFCSSYSAHPTSTTPPVCCICTFCLHLCYSRKVSMITAFPLGSQQLIIKWLPTPFYTHVTDRVHLGLPPETRGTREGGGTGCYARSPSLFAQPNWCGSIRCYPTVISPYFALVLCLPVLGCVLWVPTLSRNLPHKAFRKFALFEIELP